MNKFYTHQAQPSPLREDKGGGLSEPYASYAPAVVVSLVFLDKNHN